MSEIQNEKSIIYFDQDGVLANFDKRFAELTKGDHWFQSKENDDEKWKIINKCSTFFADLEWIPGSKKLYEFLLKQTKYDLGILSARAKRVPVCKEQKLIWLQRETPEIPLNKIIIADSKKDKKLYAINGNILLDDLSSNVDDFNLVGGTGILFKNALQAIVALQDYVQADYSLYYQYWESIKEEIS